MRKLIVPLTVVTFGIAAAWIYFSITAVFSAERDLLARLDDLTSYYASLDAEYVQPLTGSPVLSDGDKATLASISEDLQKLSNSKNPNEQFDNLLVAQKSMMSFFMTPGLPTEFTADPRYSNWNKNASNVGTASRFVYDYNVSLSLYNARLKSPIGKLASYWHTLDHRSYIGIDGTLQDETRVSF